MPVAQDLQQTTAFVTSFGLHQFRRRPFGSLGAPTPFQRTMDKLLESLCKHLPGYLVIISLSWSEHLQHLGANCQRLQEAGLIAKPQMCQSWITQRVYLGHTVGEGRVKRKLPSSKQPRSSGVLRTKKKVHLFLGLTGSLYSITHQ